MPATAFFRCLLLPLAAAAVPAVTDGTGCMKRMTAVCPGWKSDNATCVECVVAHIGELKPNCTLEKAEAKCAKFAPTPAPVPTPAPAPCPPLPLAPAAAAVTPLARRRSGPLPHLILFVIDDQGWANVGYNNPDHVLTPSFDALAKEGVLLRRHYVYRWCAPTRAALMTGRLPVHVHQSGDHVEREMTMLPAKLKQAGYATHQVGKWHLGAVAPWMTPHGRGFDTSLGYLSGGEDHYTQVQRGNIFGCVGVDLYRTDAPAYAENGTYGAFIYNGEVVRVVRAHDASSPLFMYVALQDMHAPQQVPASYSGLYQPPTYSQDFAIMNGMASVADEVLGNMTAELRAKGMWEDTLLVVTSDNGGPAGQASSGHSGNNWPLRGGKTNMFDGGVRVAAFASGGVVPSAVRGTEVSGYMHGCDWYPTMLGLAGVDASDDHAGIPGVDGVDMWPYLTGATAASPRTEMLLSSEKLSGSWNGALISGDWKLIIGTQSYGFWQAPNYPNSSTDHSTELPVECGNGCLFNIQQDPSEYVDLAGTMPEKLRAMQCRFQQLNNTYDAPKISTDTDKCEAFKAAHRGFLGPYLTGDLS